MKTLDDCFGHRVRLTDERIAHILAHPEMEAMGAEIEQVLRYPQLVRRLRSDETARLFYEFYAQTVVGAFVVTAYLTDKPKAGEDLWPTKN